jgi:hypothetical protein
VAATLLFAAPANAEPSQVVSCGNGTGTGDGLDRGFYVTGYPGSNLHDVTLHYETSNGAVAHTIMLTARLGTYDGPVIGTASVTSASIPTSSFLALNFTFPDPAVAAGSTIAFTQTFTGAGSMLYDFSGGLCPGVIETEGTTPPLDSLRFGGRGVVVTINQDLIAAPPPPTGERARALKRCKHKKHKKARKKCRRKANQLPV